MGAAGEEGDRMSFIARHDLWSADQRRAADEVSRRIEAEGLEVVRLSFPDLHGILRGKAPARTDRCIWPGRRAPRACPA